jgi:uncharacterized protein DUF4382
MSRRLARLAFALLGLLIAAALDGCEHGFVGIIDLDISSIPTPGIEQVVLAIKGVRLVSHGQQTILEYGTEEQVDIEAGRTAILHAVEVPVGDYQSVRIEIDPAESYVMTADGRRYALDVPALYPSTADFVIGEGLTTKMLVSIDQRRALSSGTQAGMPVYKLSELSRLVDLDAVSNITGSVSTDMMVGSLSVTDPGCDPQVYVFPGAGAVPEGFFVPVPGGTPPLVSSSTFTLRTTQDLYGFSATLVPPGTYTVAVTCSAEDVPGSKSIDFTPTQDATVTVGHNTTLRFTPSN